MKQFFALNTISKKLQFILMSVAIISTLTVTSIFSAFELSSAKREQVESLQSLSQMLSPNITAALLFDDQDAIQELINPILLRSDVLSITVTNIEDIVLAQALSKRFSTNNIDNDLNNITQVITPLTLDNQHYGDLHISVDDSLLTERVKFYGQFIILILLSSFIASFFLSLFLRRKFLSPMLYLANISQKITVSQDYSLRAKVQSEDEIGQLTTYFNSMLDNIEQRESLLESEVKLRTLELENANSQLHEFAYQDGLTQLPNRRYFYEKLQSLIEVDDMVFALIFIDLDGFKEVNDTLGHDYGDLLLHQVAKRLRRCVRDHDTVARLGGDEFTLILQNVSDLTQASAIAENVKNSLMQCISIKEAQVNVTGSIGLTFYPADGQSVEALVKHADQAMYLSKSKGRNRYEFFSHAIEEQAIEKRRLIEEIRLALKLNQFVLFYQPIFDQFGLKAEKAEALIRWNHPQRGLIGPNEFIPVAEQNGLIEDIGNWVRDQAIEDAAYFYQLSGNIMQVSVNTSPLQIDPSGLWVDEWILACNKHRLPRDTMIIEVTENTLMDPDSPIQQQMQRLNHYGIDIAIDDFGVGYSSLAYLQRLDIDILKIDRSFIQHMETNESSIALVRAIITMAHHLKVKVVAEGVETEGQHKLLEQLSCDYLQGYLFAKPMPTQDFIDRYISSAALIHV
ncbi:putative bifunctional diguanylate cyclase/phosphodiesterase [Shewanella livingstonensis]|uniref:EAL domain-containing protein n=1 Tax=Shewanella livingstonensis TaxID=150120 RepID=A0A3G8LTY4_9GAMM|nr:EAL domain-containing protein [Shewanella livingstonensis]AZG72270.1 EAL domain-containing protein [Shewanella livingstonensis]